ncbi:hypothetical protein QYF36_000176 [Acer negundo]|nr:hypothetical protein QYF36_000176 [Acer negundo]
MWRTWLLRNQKVQGVVSQVMVYVFVWSSNFLAGYLAANEIVSVSRRVVEANEIRWNHPPKEGLPFRSGPF